MCVHVSVHLCESIILFEISLVYLQIPDTKRKAYGPNPKKKKLKNQGQLTFIFVDTFQDMFSYTSFDNCLSLDFGTRTKDVVDISVHLSLVPLSFLGTWHIPLPAPPAAVSVMIGPSHWTEQK